MSRLRSALRAYTIISNFIACFVGICVIIVGLIMRFGDKITQTIMDAALYKYKASIAATSANNTGQVDLDMNAFLQSAAEGTMSVGVIMIAVSLFGMITAWRKHKVLIKVYISVCTILFALEAVPLILLYASSTSVLHNPIRKALKQELEDKYTGFYGTDLFTLMWNVVMTQGACCGVDPYTDFSSYKSWGKKETIDGIEVTLTTPIPCCRDLPESFDVSCAQNANKDVNNLENGCYDIYWKWTIGSTGCTVVVWVAIGIFQMLPGASTLAVLRLDDTGQVGPYDDISPVPPVPLTTYSHSEAVKSIDITRTLIVDMFRSTKALHQRLKRLKSDEVVVTFSRDELSAIREALTCVICHGAMVHPMFAFCCKTLMGCESCVTKWYQDDTKTCPKCRNSDGKKRTQKIVGIDEAIKPLLRLVEPI